MRARDRYAAFRPKRRRENNEGCARYAGGAFRRYQQDEKQSDLMPDIKRRVRGLSWLFQREPATGKDHLGSTYYGENYVEGTPSRLKRAFCSSLSKL